MRVRSEKVRGFPLGEFAVLAPNAPTTITPGKQL
jgi:hypothetical protein